MDGADLLDALTRAGTESGDLVGLTLDPAVGLGAATGRGSWSVAAADLAPAVIPVEDALRPSLGVVVQRDRGQPGSGGSSGGHRVGCGRGPPPALRRLGGRSGPGVGGRPRLGGRDHPEPRPSGPFHLPGRRRRRPGGSRPPRRPSPPRVAGRWLAPHPRTASRLGRAGRPGGHPATRPPGRSRRSTRWPRPRPAASPPRRCSAPR